MRSPLFFMMKLVPMKMEELTASRMPRACSLSTCRARAVVVGLKLRTSEAENVKLGKSYTRVPSLEERQLIWQMQAHRLRLLCQAGLLHPGKPPQYQARYAPPAPGG